MANEYIKLYRIIHHNRWPYEEVDSVSLVDRNDLSTLRVDFKNDSSYRCYRRHPDQYVGIYPMEACDESWEGAGGLEISPYELLVDRPLAMQIDYVLFDSWRASDYEKYQGLVDDIKNGTFTPMEFPPELRPQRVVACGDDESHPWSALHLEGTKPPDHPTSAFYVSERSDLPIINNHTIPDGVDFGFVQVAVIDYNFYKTLPTYDELLTRLDQYCEWFATVRSKSSESPPRRARTRRQDRK